MVLSLPVVLRDYQFTTPNALIQRWPFWVTWLIRTCGMFVTKEKIAEHGTKDKKKKKVNLKLIKKKKTTTTTRFDTNVSVKILPQTKTLVYLTVACQLTLIK